MSGLTKDEQRAMLVSLTAEVRTANESARWQHAMDLIKREVASHLHPTHCYACHERAKSERRKAKAKTLLTTLALELDGQAALTALPQQCAHQFTPTDRCRMTASPGRSLCRSCESRS